MYTVQGMKMCNHSLVCHMLVHGLQHRQVSERPTEMWFSSETSNVPCRIMSWDNLAAHTIETIESSVHSHGCDMLPLCLLQGSECATCTGSVPVTMCIWRDLVMKRSAKTQHFE